MNSRSKPKQFLEMHGKPIIIYTIEHFEYHPQVDNMVVVCLKDWIDELKILLDHFDIRKVVKIVPGGSTGQESIFNGLKAMKEFCQSDDIVVINDGVRPLITEELISNNISIAKKYGTAITAEPAKESVVESADGYNIDSIPDRNNMYVAKAPQSFKYGLIFEAYKKAVSDGIQTVDSSHLLSIYGYKMHMVKSTPNNIKITTPTDYYIFRALYEAMENYQIIGI